MPNKKLTKNEQEKVAKKIVKIAHEEPGMMHKQVVGKAVGMVKQEKKKK